VRLDHLLSKEHHETHAPPTSCGTFGVCERFVGWASPVVGVVLVHNKHAGVSGIERSRAGGNSLNTLLGFETTSPRRFFALLVGEPEAVIALSGVAPGVLSGVVVVAPLGGGVWCLICG
jgi:hypothetical protein